MKSHSMLIVILLATTLETTNSQLNIFMNKCPHCSVSTNIFDLISLSWGRPPGDVCLTKCLNLCMSNIVGFKLDTCVPTIRLLNPSTSRTSKPTTTPKSTTLPHTTLSTTLPTTTPSPTTSTQTTSTERTSSLTTPSSSPSLPTTLTQTTSSETSPSLSNTSSSTTPLPTTRSPETEHKKPHRRRHPR